MSEEYNELSNMISSDREDIKFLKKQYEEDLTMLINKIKEYNITDFSIKEEYDLDNDFSKYKTDDIFLKYDLKNFLTDYKLLLLNKCISDLSKEKKLNEFIKDKEMNLSNEEYLTYTSDIQEKSVYIKNWYEEFKKLEN